MDCIHAPTSINDAEAIIEACAGPNWRSAFLLGLGTLVAALVLVAIIVWVIRESKWKN